MEQTYIIRDPDEGVFAAAIADLVPWPESDSKDRIITRINVMERYRRQGYGTMILIKIFKDADKEDVTLFVEPSPSGGLNRKGLEKWYERHGFIWGDWYMVRKPLTGE